MQMLRQPEAVRSPSSWGNRPLRVTWHGCWEQNLTSEPSLQSHHILLRYHLMKTFVLSAQFPRKRECDSLRLPQAYFLLLSLKSYYPVISGVCQTVDVAVIM